MEPLALKLEILKGPRKGETLEYRPGSKIRIGRVVRGNNLPIKDSGISTNHLVIDSESGQWMVRDLDSSNGTIVNDTALNPNTPFELSDGDQIKIGEYTSISVKIDGGHEEEGRLRRNPRRAAVGMVGAAPANRGRRGRVAKESEVVQVEAKSEVENENHEEIEVVEKLKRGRGRPPKKARVLKSEEEEVAVPEVSSRAATRSKNAVVDSENCGAEWAHVKIEPKRLGRKRKNVQEEHLVCEKGNAVVSVSVNGDIDDRGEVPEQKQLGETGPVDDGKGSNLGDERHEEAAVGFSVGQSGDTNYKAKDSNLGREEATAGLGVGESGNDSEKAKDSNLGDEDAAVDCIVGEGGNKVESGSRSCSGVSGANNVDKKGSGSGVTESLGKIWQEEPDLEKMTLDDWFDYVEVSWPKVVNAEIDKICAGMREKARLVQEYIAQHKKEKGQS